MSENNSSSSTRASKNASKKDAVCQRCHGLRHGPGHRGRDGRARYDAGPHVQEGQEGLGP